MDIKLESQPNLDRLTALGVFQWPIWTKEISEFSWYYDLQETCYFLTGEVVVTLDDGTVVQMGQGDLVTFPAGMHCTWKILQDVKKHYRME